MVKDWPRHVVAACVVAIAAGILWKLFHDEIPEANRDIAMIAVGVALGWVGSVVNFHFGSSQGSKDKAEHLARMGGDDAERV